LAFDGCNLDQNFQCANRECVTNPSNCVKASNANPTTAGNYRRLMATPTYDPTEPCTTNCLATKKTTNLKMNIDLTKTTDITIAVNGLTPISSLIIPSGAMRWTDTNNPATSAEVHLRPVGENRMRNAINKVVTTRVHKDEFDYNPYLSFAGSVVSPAFECNVAEGIQEPFAFNISFTSLVDNIRRTGTTQWVEDVCLARLQEFAEFRVWRCMFPDPADRRLICQGQKGCKEGPFPVRPSNSLPPDNQVRSVINRCTQNSYYTTLNNLRVGTVFAFITAPLATFTLPPKPTTDPIKENIKWIVLGTIGVGLLLGALFYCAFRMYRYRAKYHKQKKEADFLKQEVENMQNFGAEAGYTDKEVAMTVNPLAAKIENLDAAVKKEDIDLKKAEIELRDAEASVRTEALREMRERRAKMASELEIMKNQLKAQTSASVATTHEEHAPTSTAHKWEATASTDMTTDYSAPQQQAAPAQQFGAPQAFKPKKREM